MRLSEEQSVVGRGAASIEHITDSKPQKKDVLQFIGRTVQLEQRNQAMNYFIGVLVEKMRDAGIYTLLVKGQVSIDKRHLARLESRSYLCHQKDQAP